MVQCGTRMLFTGGFLWDRFVGYFLIGYFLDPYPSGNVHCTCGRLWPLTASPLPTSTPWVQAATCGYDPGFTNLQTVPTDKGTQTLSPMAAAALAGVVGVVVGAIAAVAVVVKKKSQDAPMVLCLCLSMCVCFCVYISVFLSLYVLFVVLEMGYWL